MRIRHWQNFWSGAMFFAIGLGFSLGATSYSIGEASRMGPGYFPFWLGVILSTLGIWICVSSFLPKSGDTLMERIDWRVVMFVIGPVFLFASILDLVGIIAAVGILVILSSLASHVFSWRVSMLNALIMAGLVWIVFVVGLGIIFPAPSWFSSI